MLTSGDGPWKGHGAQRLEGHLGVNGRCGLRAMPEDLRDFRYGSAMANHFGCQSVSKLVSSAATGTMNIGSRERPPHDVTDGGGTCQSNSRRQPSQEDLSRGTDAAILTKTDSQSLADFR